MGMLSPASGFAGSPVAIALILLAGVASVVLALVGVMAFRRRRSPSYLLVATALVVLAMKALLGWMTIVGIVGVEPHYLIGHALDLLMALLLIAAIYVARSPHRCGLFGSPSDSVST